MKTYIDRSGDGLIAKGRIEFDDLAELELLSVAVQTALDMVVKKGWDRTLAPTYDRLLKAREQLCTQLPGATVDAVKLELSHV